MINYTFWFLLDELLVSTNYHANLGCEIINWFGNQEQLKTAIFQFLTFLASKQSTNCSKKQFLNYHIQFFLLIRLLK